MNKKEINEIKKNFSEDCGFFTIGNVFTAMVSAEKNVFYKAVRPAFSVSTEEIELIIENLKKTLTGKLGKNLREYPFGEDALLEGGTQSVLYETMKSKFEKDEDAEPLLNLIVDNLEYGATYAIISAHCTYSVLNSKAKKRNEHMEDDASEEFDYNFIITAICPVNLHFEGLIYDDINKIICKKEGADRIIEAPSDGFLFPLFNDRAPDINGILYYTKTPKKANVTLIEDVLGCCFRMNCEAEKDAFNYILKNVVGDDLDLESINEIQRNIKERIDTKSHQTEAVMLDCNDISTVLWESGVEQDKLESLPKVFAASMGDAKELTAGNLVENKTVIETPGISVNVAQGYEDKVKTEVINGQRCIVISVDDPQVVINGLETKI